MPATIPVISEGNNKENWVPTFNFLIGCMVTTECTYKYEIQYTGRTSVRAIKVLYNLHYDSVFTVHSHCQCIYCTVDMFSVHVGDIPTSCQYVWTSLDSYNHSIIFLLYERVLVFHRLK